MAENTPPPDDDLPPDDGSAALFRAAIGPVRRLPETPLPPAVPKPRARAHMAERDDAQARSEFRLAMEDKALLAGDEMRYRRDEVPQRVLQKLARGQYAVQDELDL